MLVSWAGSRPRLLEDLVDIADGDQDRVDDRLDADEALGDVSRDLPPANASSSSWRT
jgi:hypothetical protein